MDTRAMIKIKGVIVNNNSFLSPDSRQSESSVIEGFRANQTGKEHQVYFGLQNSNWICSRVTLERDKGGISFSLKNSTPVVSAEVRASPPSNRQRINNL